MPEKNLLQIKIVFADSCWLYALSYTFSVDCFFLVQPCWFSNVVKIRFCNFSLLAIINRWRWRDLFWCHVVNTTRISFGLIKKTLWSLTIHWLIHFIVDQYWLACFWCLHQVQRFYSAFRHLFLGWSIKKCLNLRIWVNTSQRSRHNCIVRTIVYRLRLHFFRFRCRRSPGPFYSFSWWRLFRRRLLFLRALRVWLDCQGTTLDRRIPLFGRIWRAGIFNFISLVRFSRWRGRDFVGFIKISTKITNLSIFKNLMLTKTFLQFDQLNPFRFPCCRAGHSWTEAAGLASG